MASGLRPLTPVRSRAEGAAASIDQAQLERLARIADRLLGGRPLIPHGPHPRRDRPGRGLEFLELRPYGVGDDPREIDWRATARSRHPLVRLRRDEALSTVHLCLDRSASMRDDSGRTWELARELATAFSYLLLRAGNRVGLLAFSADVEHVVPPGRGRAGYARLAAALASLEPRHQGGSSQLATCARRIESGALAVVVSDFLDAGFMRAGLDALRARGGAIEVLALAPPLSAEGITPEVGTVWLRDAETGERRVHRLDAQALRSASESVDALRDALAAYCRRCAIPLTSCEVEASWLALALRHLRTIQALRA